MQLLSSTPTKLAKRRGRQKSLISLTPLIDVVFILLVFFMLASSFLDWQTLSLDATSAAKTAVSEAEPFIIRVNGDSLILSQQPLSLEATVAAAIQREPVTKTVNLQPVGDTTVQQIVAVLDALSQAGVTPLKMIDDPEWQSDQVESLGVAR
ncbi:MAG: biopolymer transporter ExbD [Pseudomonadota bacterium]